MRPRVNFALVGAFVIVLGAVLTAAALWLLIGKPGRIYDVYNVDMTESVSGLSVDAPVKFRGLDVGRVRSIELNPARPEVIRLELDIERGTPIRRDTVAYLEFQGLTGIAFINLKGGSPDAPAPVVGPGERYPILDSGPSLLLRMDEGLSRLITSTTEMSERMRDVLDDSTRVALRDILQRLARVVTVLDERSESLDRSMANVAVVLDRVTEATEDLPGMMNRMDATVVNVRQLSDEMLRMAEDLREVAVTGGENLSRLAGDTGSGLRVLSADLELTLRRLDRVLRRVEDDPQSFILGPPTLAGGPGE